MTTTGDTTICPVDGADLLDGFEMDEYGGYELLVCPLNGGHTFRIWYQDGTCGPDFSEVEP